MTKIMTVSARFDEFGRTHPGLMWSTAGCLAVCVALVLLTITEAPVVLYQAF